MQEVSGNIVPSNPPHQGALLERIAIMWQALEAECGIMDEDGVLVGTVKIERIPEYPGG